MATYKKFYDDVYLKEYNDGGFAVWASGYEEPKVVYGYVLNDADPVELDEGKDPEGNPQLQVEGLEMKAGETIYFANITDPENIEVISSLDFGNASNFILHSSINSYNKCYCMLQGMR